MKKLSYLIILALILGLVLTGCLLSNVGQVPSTQQSGITYLTKGSSSGLVGLWHFDEGGTSTTTSDSSASGNTGTLVNGPQWVTGMFDQALSFDGVDDYVDIYDSLGSLDITGPITVEAWVKFDSVAMGKDSVIARKWNAYSLQKYIDDKLEGWVKIGGTWYGVRGITGGTALTSDTWYHLAFTYDNANVRTYVNGSLDRIGTVAGYIDTTTGNASIGTDLEGYGGYTAGIIDEVRIWNIALQPEDILNPAISVEKKGPEYAYVGDNITYTYTVANTGYVPLSGVVVTDSLGITVIHDDSSDTNNNGLLDLEEDWIFTAAYTVPSGVVSPLVNTATASGTNLLDNEVVKAEASWSVAICYEETAWAYGEDEAEPNNEVEDNPSNAWGWTNEFKDETEFLELELWAAAGQNNTDNGFLVGTVTVYLVDGCVMVDYLITNTDQDYMITEAHLWVGNTSLPMVKRGKKEVPTSAPGQFSKFVDYDYFELDLGGQYAEFVVCEVDVEDDFWVAAHAVIEWCEEEDE